MGALVRARAHTHTHTHTAGWECYFAPLSRCTEADSWQALYIYIIILCILYIFIKYLIVLYKTPQAASGQAAMPYHDAKQLVAEFFLYSHHSIVMGRLATGSRIPKIIY